MKSNYEIAKKRVKKKSEFRSHLASYVITMGFLLAINLLTSSDYLWVMWPALGWGIGIAFHALDVYGSFSDKDREEAMIEKELRRIEDKERYAEDNDRLELRDIEKEVKPRYDDEDFV